MTRILKTIAMGAALALGLSAPASAELSKGAFAPGFSTQVALAGKQSGFSLRAALAKGPVVLYFYPKAFTKGCTLEANAFAEAMDEFKAAGATVVGMSNDDIATLKRFSTEECRDAFAVGVASPQLIKAYDVALIRDGKDSGVANRTSYVIAQNGKIVLVHSDLDYRDHVRLTLDAVRQLNKGRR
ncbi:peroxiredoxin [Altererythrobacter arenosus]|uniref:thioredoxin-dependent peroxiredoxin n=1 Tax=Altererythrobacter arenosus TaxID=3032592 RepID=A0ABY8FQ77_9SPHN|nr:peroxiredoxin [Altererythrobacter sp. CAU 1644]WFL77169.1 peroxiredoxin [Altererythrobacter sp. CAU 1644]